MLERRKATRKTAKPQTIQSCNDQREETIYTQDMFSQDSPTHDDVFAATTSSHEHSTQFLDEPCSKNYRENVPRNGEFVEMDMFIKTDH